jgi:hypothetical protein
MMESEKGTFLSRVRPMKKAKPGLHIILFLSLVVSLAAPVEAKEAYLSDIVVTNTRDHLLVYFSVNDCFTVDMNRAIESGINTTFTFFIKLYEKRNFWWDKEITDMEISHSIKYDNLKKVYEVRLSEQDHKDRKGITVKGFDEAKRLMADVVALKVTPLHNLQRGGRYQLQMMAELDKIRLPLYLPFMKEYL